MILEVDQNSHEKSISENSTGKFCASSEPLPLELRIRLVNVAVVDTEICAGILIDLSTK